MGRPRIELTDKQVELIEKLAGLGLTQAQIADFLPMSERTLRDRIADPNDTAVSAAYARGRAKDAEELSSLHRKIARGEASGVSVTDQRKALEWRLERQHKWSQRQEIEHSGKIEGGVLRVPAADVDPELWDQMAKRQGVLEAKANGNGANGNGAGA